MQKIISLFLIVQLSIFTEFSNRTEGFAKAVEHTSWTALLQKHVSIDGKVDYKGFIQDKTAFEAYLVLLSDNPPDKKTWSEAEQLAYWINAYNAFTVKLIIDHYPVASIKDIKNGIPFINSVWDIKFFKIGSEEVDLNTIEHRIIRTQFKEPRIHFAVNCASYSCPPLRNEAYTAERLDAQLTDQTKIFLADTRKNKVENTDKFYLSSLFKWYSTDFTEQGLWSRIFGGSCRDENLIKFIAPYINTKVTSKTAIEFMDYNWSLNE